MTRIHNLKFREFNQFNGDCYGFSTAQRQTRLALERQGVNIVHDSKFELQHLSAHLYKRNTEFSFLTPTHEADDIHPSLIKKINECFEVIALCQHNKEVFKRNGVTKKIHVVTQGINLDVFKYNKKKRGDKLKFLWIGQTSVRKGWDILSKSFNQAFGQRNDVHLYLKTTGAGNQEIINIGNITLDTRNLALVDLLDIYDDNHIFVSCSHGESTNLPALEAMASGLICMAPQIQGMKEFIHEDTAIPLEVEYVDANYGVKTKAPSVKVSDLIEKLRYVYDYYENLQTLTINVRSYIKNNNDINKMADKLIKIIFREELYAKNQSLVYNQKIVL